jgi:kinetochore protein Mis13/DSN1
MPTLTPQTRRLKVEEAAWLNVANYYNSYRTNVLDRQLARTPSSAIVKGKQRAKLQEVEDWADPRESELPEVFRGVAGVGLARSIVSGADLGGEGEEGRKSPLSVRLEGLEFKVLFLIYSY